MINGLSDFEAAVGSAGPVLLKTSTGVEFYCREMTLAETARATAIGTAGHDENGTLKMSVEASFGEAIAYVLARSICDAGGNTFLDVPKVMSMPREKLEPFRDAIKAHRNAEREAGNS
jgi:hypothetical protein